LPTMTISGLASGLDTDEIIQRLMEIERQPVKRLEQRKADLEVDKNAWRDIGSRLSNLLGTLTSLKLESTFEAKTATSSDPKALTATASADAVPGTYKIWIKQLAQAHKVRSAPQSSWVASTTGSFTIGLKNGQSVTVQVMGGDTLETLATKISNATTNDGKRIVSATVIRDTSTSPETLTLVITSLVSGTAGEMVSFVDQQGILESLDVIKQGTVQHVLLQARDAEFKIDGLPENGVFKSSTNTVSGVIKGVTLNLLAVTDSNGNGALEPSEEITLEVTKNTQAAVDAEQKFIDQYNSAMDFIASKLGKTATGEPGGLFGDPTLARIQQELRELVFNPVALTDTKYTSAGSVGISTGAVSTSGLTFDRSGKLTLDVAELTKALGEDAKGVAELFTYNKDGVAGIAVRLDEYLKRITKASLGTTPSAGDGVISTKQKWIDLQIKDIDEQIARWEDRLALREEQLRRQFTAMESMLGTLQSQANWLAGQIASLQSLNLARTQK